MSNCIKIYIYIATRRFYVLLVPVFQVDRQERPTDRDIGYRIIMYVRASII